MTKKFELSAYGVEEMNQKELVDVEGGLFFAVEYVYWLLATPEGQSYLRKKYLEYLRAEYDAWDLGGIEYVFYF
ncbi:MAG: hypothetical protein LBC68_00565 [Prevotellaceae bacterium]|jgi:hypothetical protein|nr:hypothetical protein [Prevotellaceae bacterium]